MSKKTHITHHRLLADPTLLQHASDQLADVPTNPDDVLSADDVTIQSRVIEEASTAVSSLLGIEVDAALAMMASGSLPPLVARDVFEYLTSERYDVLFAVLGDLQFDVRVCACAQPM